MKGGDTMFALKFRIKASLNQNKKGTKPKCEALKPKLFITGQQFL